MHVCAHIHVCDVMTWWLEKKIRLSNFLNVVLVWIFAGFQVCWVSLETLNIIWRSDCDLEIKLWDCFPPHTRKAINQIITENTDRLWTLLRPGAMLILVSHVTTEDNWSPWFLRPPEAMLMSAASAVARNHVEIHGQCCYWWYMARKILFAVISMTADSKLRMTDTEGICKTPITHKRDKTVYRGSHWWELFNREGVEVEFFTVDGFRQGWVWGRVQFSLTCWPLAFWPFSSEYKNKLHNLDVFSVSLFVLFCFAGSHKGGSGPERTEKWMV